MCDTHNGWWSSAVQISLHSGRQTLAHKEWSWRCPQIAATPVLLFACLYLSVGAHIPTRRDIAIYKHTTLLAGTPTPLSIKRLLGTLQRWSRISPNIKIGSVILCHLRDIAINTFCMFGEKNSPLRPYKLCTSVTHINCQYTVKSSMDTQSYSTRGSIPKYSIISNTQTWCTF